MAIANCIIEQHPNETRMPVGQPVIFAVSNNQIVANETKVKFIANVYISNKDQPVMSSNDDIVGSFKTTPNNAGVGIFDFSSVIENYLKADNLARIGSQYKETDTGTPTNHPIHLIDKFSGNNNAIRYFAVRFKCEFLGADASTPNLVSTPSGTSVDTDAYKIFNGYLKHTDKLELDGVNFGFDFSPFYLNSSSVKFLTNAPAIQYANINDYGTFPVFNRGGEWEIEVKCFDSTGSPLLNFDVPRSVANGAIDYNSEMGFEILYFGCFPANLQNWNSSFRALVAAGTIQGGYITVQAEAINVPGFSAGDPLTQLYTINVNCANTKNYEPIRLCWLNQWGGWDYYTFIQKSSRMISTKGSTYNQISGTWNESSYRLNGFKGGKKAFRVNATEKITMNTDFVNESESEWFEELINSPEVYMLKGYEDIVETESALIQYVTPVTLTTSSYTRKTKANDKLMQYTFEVEKSKTLRTQSI